MFVVAFAAVPLAGPLATIPLYWAGVVNEPQISFHHGGGHGNDHGTTHAAETHAPDAAHATDHFVLSDEFTLKTRSGRDICPVTYEIAAAHQPPAAPILLPPRYP